MKKFLMALIFTTSAIFVKAQATKIQLSGKYKIDTLADTGRYLKDPKQFVILTGREGVYFTGLLGKQKIYFRPLDIVFNDEFANWIRQQVEKAKVSNDSLLNKR
jgi:hypothetical protein